MIKVQSFTGVIAPLDRSNVDTDQIIPKQFLKSIKRTGFGESLFFDWRYNEDGSENTNFELNKEEFKSASILVTRNNFGCGSSREHAVWAVDQYGFKAIIAAKIINDSTVLPGFADIFKNNCSKNAIVTIELSDKQVDEIFEAIKKEPGVTASVDVNTQTLSINSKEPLSYSFDIDPSVKNRLLNGLDDIGLSLQKISDIEAFENTHDTQI